MTTIHNRNLPEWSKRYHERIEGNRDLSEPMAHILKREYGIEIDRSLAFFHALKPGESHIIVKGLTQYMG